MHDTLQSNMSIRTPFHCLHRVNQMKLQRQTKNKCEPIYIKKKIFPFYERGCSTDIYEHIVRYKLLRYENINFMKIFNIIAKINRTIIKQQKEYNCTPVSNNLSLKI